jgi:hypothetical protein
MLIIKNGISAEEAGEGASMDKALQALKEPEIMIPIVGVVVSIILAYSGIRNNDIQQTLAAILSILGALAITQIIANYEDVKRNKQIETVLSILQKVSMSASTPLRLRTELEPIPTRAQNAKDILIIGRTLAISLRYTEFFEQRLRDGATIRLAMVDPNNESVCNAISPLLEMSPEAFLSDIRTSIGLINRLARATQGDGKLELRFIEFVPTLSLMVVDPQLPTGHIVVELLPYQVDAPSRPHLIFKASENPYWFAYFREVAEHIWRDAKPYKIS